MISINIISSTEISSFMTDHCLHSLINHPTCFKSADGRCIDLILTNKKHFQKSQSFETGVSDFHHLIYTMLKSTFVPIPSKMVTYRSYKRFSEASFKADLKLNFASAHTANFSSFYSALRTLWVTMPHSSKG